MAGVEQATDMAWGPGGATLRSTGTYWDGPRGEPGMTLRRARCPRTEGAGCVLRAIRTESGDMRCDGQEDRRTGTMLVTRAELRASIGQLCARQQVRCGPATTPGDMLLFAWPTELVVR